MLAVATARPSRTLHSSRPPKPNSTTQWEWFGPDEAKAALASCDGVFTNRAVKQRTIDRLIAERQDGNWCDNGETVIFDEVGALINGQHRMHVIIRTGIGMWLNVCRGVPREAFASMDRQCVRSAPDALGIAGFASEKVLGPLCGLYDAWINGRVADRRQPNPPTRAIRIASSDGALQEAAIWADKRRGKLPISPMQLAFLRYILTSADETMADEFLGSILDGADLRNGSPPLHFRNAVASGRPHLKLNRWTIVMMGIKAWNAHVSGEPMLILVWRNGERVPDVAGLRDDLQYAALAAKEDAA